MRKPFSFPKTERLKSKKHIETLFQSGEAFFVFPFKVIYLFHTPLPNSPFTTSSVQIVASVPKRKFKKAHDRNQIKRRIKEAYRLQKQPLIELMQNQHRCLHWICLYQTDSYLSFNEIQLKMNKIIKMLQDKANATQAL